jgi:hypothetical protein
VYKRSLYAAEKNEMAPTKIAANLVTEKAPTINKISPNKFKVNGPAKFIIITKNQKIGKAGPKVVNPFLRSKLRECARSYKILAPANIAEDTRPWASITHQAPARPIFSWARRLKIIKAMCTTEEYATITFMSEARQHIPPRRLPPTTLTVATIKFTGLRE